jgi:hypothetical protein
VIGDMPRTRPPHLQREVTRHGKVVWWSASAKGRAFESGRAYGTPEFDAAYQAAVSGDARPEPGVPQRAALRGWSSNTGILAHGWRPVAATRRQRENIFKHVLATAGADPASHITRKAILAGLERGASTPSQARNFLDAMRGLFEWAPRPSTSGPTRPRREGPAAPQDAGLPGLDRGGRGRL